MFLVACLCETDFAIKIHTFFCQQRFFNSPSGLFNFLMNWASNITQVLPNTYKHHHPETVHIINVFMSVSTPKSIYVVSMWSIFYYDYELQIGKRHFHFIGLNHALFDLKKLSKDTAFMFTFTSFSFVKLTASKSF